MKITQFTETKEPTPVDAKSLLCTKCGLLNAIYATSAVCSHCLVSPKGQRVKGVWELVKGSIFKDHERPLPPSVISD